MGRSVRRCGSAGGRGFTLVELAAVLAAGGATAMVAGPFGGQIRAGSREARSAEVHRGLAKQQLMYTADHAGFFAGANSSGSVYNRVSLSGADNPLVPTVFGTTASDTPTNVSDWISPIVGHGGRLPANRALRTAALFDRFGDPTADRSVDFLFGAGIPDMDDFAAVMKGSGIRQSSFLQPRAFAQYGAGTRSTVVDFANGYIQYSVVAGAGVPAAIPDDHVPTIDRVGTSLSGKVMFGDGTRYLSADGLDHDIDDGVGSSVPSPFTTNGPILDSSPAYGRAFAASPGNQGLSFRKQGGEAMYASMYDGSLRVFTREQAWTDPTPWYPTGSVWTGEGATSESAAWVKKNLPGGVIY